MIARYGRAPVALLGLLAAILAWNALRYPPGLGYDANDHLLYILDLAERQRIPDETGEYYTPPLFYAIGALLWKIGTWLDLGQPLRLIQAFNAAVVFTSAVLVLELARTMIPGRRRVHTLALGFVIASAVAVKAGAMVHPEALSLLLCTAALVAAARVITGRLYSLESALWIGVLLGLAQLVRAFALWTVAVVLLALLGAAIGNRADRRAIVGTLLGTAVVAFVVAVPWYAYQATRYTNPIFDRPQLAEPLWSRRPAEFFLDPGLPEVFTRPHRESHLNLFWPTLYSEAWGDYFGVYRWQGHQGPPDPDEKRDLTLQMVAGVLPTALAVGGWVWALVTGVLPSGLRRSPERLLIGLLPLAGLAGMLYFTVSYPTPDGDVIKGSYMLTTLPAWSVAFAVATDAVAARLPRWAGIGLAVVLLAILAVSVRFTIYGTPLGGIL